MPAPADELRTSVRRAAAQLRWYRRPAAAALLALAVVAYLGGRGADEQVVTAVVVVRDLDAGAQVTSDDVGVARLPAAAVPSQALTSTGSVVGRTLALPATAGEPLTPLRLVDRPLLDALDAGAGPELVAAGVPLADAAVAALTRAGDVVDVLASGESGSGGSVVTGARVLVPPSTDPSARAVAGPAGAPHVVLAVTAAEAATLARSSSTSRLSLALRRGSLGGTSGTPGNEDRPGAPGADAG